ncbi:hypothetical protein [Pareuzebyella sediminis]|uniref:hypothetical protein n=1 Tax=Pareuzebyella sediminis TaxID=2607998 RepID=UPI0018E14139|nr:hypothetical protein [Pareuzebyella sediminis]
MYISVEINRNVSGSFSFRASPPASLSADGHSGGTKDSTTFSLKIDMLKIAIHY